MMNFIRKGGDVLDNPLNSRSLDIELEFFLWNFDTRSTKFWSYSSKQYEKKKDDEYIYVYVSIWNHGIETQSLGLQNLHCYNPYIFAETGLQSDMQ